MYQNPEVHMTPPTTKFTKSQKPRANVLIGLKTSEAAGFDCRACGFETCAGMLNWQRAEAEFKGPNCMFKYADLESL